MASKLALSLVSLGTSAVLLCACQFVPSLSSVPLVRLLFFALLPTLVAADVVAESRGWTLFASLWETLKALTAKRQQLQQLTPAEALNAARAELFKAFSERWPHGRASLSRPAGLSSQRPEVVSSSTSGSSLYEQVKGTLQDHVFARASGDAPVYLLDPASGCFLKATHHRKLVLTSKPSAACLFYIERGKTHHWGFKAASSRRYMGQNFVQKMIVTSKKLHAWESFRVLQRPGDKGVLGCSPQIYLILCSTRFGKGMWLANKPGTSSFASPQVPTSRSSYSMSFDDELGESDRGSPGKRGVYLSKQFDHAIGLVYSSDLSKLTAVASEIGSQSGASRSLARAQTAPPGNLLQVKNTAFQAPILSSWELGDVRLPWLEAAAKVNAESGRAPSFLEMREEDMTEVLAATIPNCSVDEFLEMLVPRAARMQSRITREVFTHSAPVGASKTLSSRNVSNGEKAGDGDPLREWHPHPQFGLLRAMSYRPDASAVPGIPVSTVSQNGSRSTTPSSMKAVAIEQYHSCIVDDEPAGVNRGSGKPRKATLRSKVYTLSIPYSNCFSIEVLVDVEDVAASDDSATESATSQELGSPDVASSRSGDNAERTSLHIRWRAGVVFSRSTMLQAEIERGALEGIRTSCETILKMMREKYAKHSTLKPVSRRGSLPEEQSGVSAGDTLSALPAFDSSRGRTREKQRVSTDLAFVPRTFALEVVRGLIRAICMAKPQSESLSTLPLHLPWRAFNPANVLARSHSSTPTALAATTATPFFESSPEEFAQVLEEELGPRITARLFFEALLSDSCAFFRPSHPDSGTMEVDISAWRAFVSSLQPREKANGFIRKQVFRMPLSGIPGVDVAEVEDFQYHALVERNQDSSVSSHEHGSSREKRASLSSSNGPQSSGREKKRPLSGLGIGSNGSQPLSLGRDKKRPPSGTELSKDSKPRDAKPRRLEYGMKLFVPALPEGSLFTIEVLVVVEPAEDDPSRSTLRVFFASPPRHRHPETRAHVIVNPHVVAGVLRGLKQIWKHVAHTLKEICDASSDYVVLPHDLQHQEQVSSGLSDEEMFLVQQARGHPGLPTHDELASKLIEAIAAMY